MDNFQIVNDFTYIFDSRNTFILLPVQLNCLKFGLEVTVANLCPVDGKTENCNISLCVTLTVYFL